MRDQPVAVDLELVALGFPAEDAVVVEHQAGHAIRRAAPKRQRGGHPLMPPPTTTQS